LNGDWDTYGYAFFTTRPTLGLHSDRRSIIAKVQISGPGSVQVSDANPSAPLPVLLGPHIRLGCVPALGMAMGRLAHTEGHL
jgi:hypothetical protein